MNFLQRLFWPPNPETEPDNMSGNVEPGSIKVTNMNLCSLPPGLHIGKYSDLGQVRERNEDSFYIVASTMNTNYGEEPFGIFIVADGMGGHEKGDIASSVAANTTANALLTEIYLPILTNNHNTNSDRPINEALVAAVEQANVAVQKSAPEGGTTLTAAMVMGNSAYIAHIGDTRAYLFNKDGLKQITEDHSLAQRLKATGQATPEQIAQIENVLYRAIGQSSSIEVDTHFQYLPPGNSLLLCSDGLWKGIDDDGVIQETLNKTSSPQEACEKLVAIANNNGGDDNITIIIISIGGEA
jgi:serine/threonine protein phosphatase PrpC